LSINGLGRCFRATRVVSYISVKIREGVPVTDIAAHVGHSRKSLTLDTYAHVLIDD
jgi:hypothetical protein